MANMIKVELNKDIKVNKRLLNYLNPDYVYIPLEKDYKLTIKTGDNLKKEDIILSNKDNYIYSPISGKVLGAAGMRVGQTNNKKVIVIENDFREKNKRVGGIKRFIDKYTPDEVMSLTKEFNAFKKPFKGNILIINGIDLEPHVFTKSFLIGEYINEILETVDALYNIFDFKKCIFAIKNNDGENVDQLVNHVGTYPNIELKLLPDLYPMGDAKNLTDKLISKKQHENVLHLSVAEIYAIYNVLKRKRPITEILVTVTGDNISKGGVLNVKIGTLLKDIIKENFILFDNQYRVIINGLMGGYEINTLDFVITEDVSSIFIMKKPKHLPKKCINCGMCHNNCPRKCDPRSGYKIENCNKCGICSYICPANINFKLKENNQ